MRVITVTAISKEGTRALEKDWKEYKQSNLQERLVIRATGYKFARLNLSPYTLQLTINNEQVQDDDFVALCLKKIRLSLLDKGVEEFKDYKLELVTV